MINYSGLSLFVFVGVNIGGRKLISRFPMQQWLEVNTQWTEKEQKSENSKMVYEFRVTCDAHYYGSGCANLCRPRDDNFGHYTCSPIGEIVCLSGWKGDYCTKREWLLFFIAFFCFLFFVVFFLLLLRVLLSFSFLRTYSLSKRSINFHAVIIRQVNVKWG